MHTRSGSPAAPRPFAALLVLLALFAAPSAQAAWFYVGGDGGCNASSIQTVLNSVSSSGHEIRIARNTTYSQQALTWNVAAGVTLTLTGGFADCNQFIADSTKTTLNGAGGAAAPVLRINLGVGATVILKNLTLRGGDPAGENPGGGLHITGRGTVRIEDSSVTHNVAGNGGGIMIDGSGPGAKLVIGSGVLIAFNEARFSGGGVFVAGAALDMLEDNSVIMLNSALGTPTTGYGGGLFVRARGGAPSLVRIGSTGQGNTGAIFGNEARAGGGIAIKTFGDDPDAIIHMYSTVVGRPAVVRDNFASVAGGGIFVQQDNGLSYAYVNLWNTEIIENQAPSGAAIYITPTGGIGGINDSGYLGINRSMPEGAAACVAGVPCGAISRNRSIDANNQATDGAIIQGQRDSKIAIGSSLAGIVMADNMGGRLFDLQPDGRHLWLHNALLVDNELSDQLLRCQSPRFDDQVIIIDTTIAGNTIGIGDPVLALSNCDLRVHRSIIFQPGRTSLVRSGGTLEVSETISNDPVSLGGLPGAANLPPRFVDPERGDYRLRAASAAVDYAASAGGSDFSGDPRNVDLPFKPNAFGPRDIGAFERQTLAPLVLNGTFVTDLRLWTDANGHTVFDGQVSTNTGSGSARVSGEPPGGGTRLTGARQCIHLPGPGRYRLHGAGHAEAAPAEQRDALYLNWQLRHADNPVSCGIGAPDAEGDHFLTRGDSWFHPAPAIIDVPEDVWTVNSSITVSLVVVDNGTETPRVASGWFDEIGLAVGPIEPLPDLIFANGFE